MNTFRLALACLAGLSLVGVTEAAPSATDAELRACGHGQEREIEGPAAREPTIALVSMQPAESSYVTETTMVAAGLEYDIDRFEPGKYEVNAQFATVDAHATTGGGFSEFPEVRFAHGTLRFCYPLRVIWTRPAVKWPLALVFNLTRRNEDGSATVIASTSVTQFNVANLPASALNRASPTAEQLALRGAVEKLSGFFETVPVHVEMCAEEFPDMKSRLLPPLTEWRQRHALVQEKSDSLFVDLSRQRFPGMTKEGFLVYLEARRTGLVQALRATPEALSRRNCELMPGRLAGETWDPAKRHPEEYRVLTSFSTR
jgi:hypothetical protein